MSSASNALIKFYNGLSDASEVAGDSVPDFPLPQWEDGLLEMIDADLDEVSGADLPEALEGAQWAEAALGFEKMDMLFGAREVVEAHMAAKGFQGRVSTWARRLAGKFSNSAAGGPCEILARGGVDFGG